MRASASAIDFGGISKMIVSFLARNFFTLKLIALVIAFTINFMLLFYKVSVLEGEEGDDDMDLGGDIEEAAVDDGGGEDGDDGEDGKHNRISADYGDCWTTDRPIIRRSTRDGSEDNDDGPGGNGGKSFHS